MKHQSPEQLREAAAIVAAHPLTQMTRRERIDRWADLLERHAGHMEALYRIEYLSDDELLEVTPENIRIRKRVLDSELRGKQQKKVKEELLEA